MSTFPLAGRFNKWPIGAMGDFTVSATDEFIDWSASSVDLDYRNLTVPFGKTLWIRVIDGTPVVLGVAGNLSLGGTIRVVEKFTSPFWDLSAVKSRNLRDGRLVSWTTPGVRTGGTGGRGGYFGAMGGDGGAQIQGYGGGGGGGAAWVYSIGGSNGGDGGAQTQGNGGAYHYAGSCLAIAGVGTDGNASVGSNGLCGLSTQWTAYGGDGGGTAFNLGDFGGGGWTSGGGGAGASIVASTYDIPVYGSAGGGGGSGGLPGRNGACLFIQVMGITSGAGVISAAGETGGTGYRGGDVSECNISGASSGGGGGGGGGGHGGKIIMKHNSISIPFSVIATRGDAGYGGAGGTSTYGGIANGNVGAAGTNGTAGTVSVTVS